MVDTVFGKATYLEKLSSGWILVGKKIVMTIGDLEKLLQEDFSEASEFHRRHVELIFDSVQLTVEKIFHEVKEEIMGK